MTQPIIFPMEYLNITQGYGVGTHVGTFAIDNAGRDKNIDNLFAPFTGKIRKKWANGNTVWLESIDPVEFADGTVDYAVAMFTHDNSITDLAVGQVVQQGVNFYQEGTAGNATGNHVHIEIGKGKYRPEGWYQIPAGQPGAGTWVINDRYKPEKAFFLSGTEIINAGGYAWKGIEMSKFTQDQERVMAQMATGYNPGKDYNYPATQEEITSDNLDKVLQMWRGRVSTITKEMENAVADGISGVENYIGWAGYNSQFIGQPIVSHYPQMVKFWIDQKPATPTPEPSKKYVPYEMPKLFVEAPQEG